MQDDKSAIVVKENEKITKHSNLLKLEIHRVPSFDDLRKISEAKIEELICVCKIPEKNKTWKILKMTHCRLLLNLKSITIPEMFIDKLLINYLIKKSINVIFSASGIPNDACRNIDIGKILVNDVINYINEELKLSDVLCLCIRRMNDLTLILNQDTITTTNLKTIRRFCVKNLVINYSEKSNQIGANIAKYLIRLRTLRVKKSMITKNAIEKLEFWNVLVEFIDE
jgi:hypothetical protein